eukprot:1855624-Prymnesium_polylepis.1
MSRTPRDRVQSRYQASNPCSRACAHRPRGRWLGSIRGTARRFVTVRGRGEVHARPGAEQNGRSMGSPARHSLCTAWEAIVLGHVTPKLSRQAHLRLVDATVELARDDRL